MHTEASARILLTGGLGKTSSRIAQLLSSQGYRVRRAGRSLSRAGGERAEEHFSFDWFDDSNHDALLQDVHAVYLVSPPSLQPAEFMIPFIRRALDASVTRFVLLSSASIPENSPPFGPVHRFLREHAPEWAVLRPSYFMQNFTEGGHLYTLRESGQIFTAAGDGKVAFVDADDIAAVGFHALTDEEPHNREHIITGPESLSYDEAAGIIRRVTGLDAKHCFISSEELAVRHTAAGLPADYAGFLARMDDRIRLEGMEDQVTDTVRRVTGREPRHLEKFIRDNKASFQFVPQNV